MEIVETAVVALNSVEGVNSIINNIGMTIAGLWMVKRIIDLVYYTFGGVDRKTKHNQKMNR